MAELPTVQRSLELYAGLMEEAKERLNVIFDVAHWEKIPPKYVTEFCALQFRMLCEIVALGSLVAHGDIGTLDVKWLKDEKWQAAEIMKALGRLHPSFFPRQHKIIRNDDHVHFESVRGAITKEQMTTFYGKLGESLHMGTLARKLAGQAPRPYTLEEIKANAMSIHELLSIHLITLIDGTIVGCILRASNLNGRTQMFVASSSPPPGA